jgi:hypothetical protein
VRSCQLRPRSRTKEEACKTRLRVVGELRELWVVKAKEVRVGVERYLNLAQGLEMVKAS